jgi:hypothetical protein
MNIPFHLNQNIVIKEYWKKITFKAAEISTIFCPKELINSVAEIKTAIVSLRGPLVDQLIQ